jgi:hypothetical protein
MGESLLTTNTSLNLTEAVTDFTTYHENENTGEGVRVGVLDLSFAGFLEFERQASLSVTTHPSDDRVEYNTSTVPGTGTYSLEVIHTVAPDAELYACRYEEINDFIRCTGWFISEGVDIIHHGTVLPNIAADGANLWDQQIDAAARNDILWVNGAGNYFAGYIEDTFSQDLDSPFGEESFNLFETLGNVRTVGIDTLGDYPIEIMIDWFVDDPTIDANTIDLNLQIVDLETREIIATSTIPQRGNSDTVPIERIRLVPNRPLGIRVVDTNLTAIGLDAEVIIGLHIEFLNLNQRNPLQANLALAGNSNALTVGTVSGDTIANYSSEPVAARGVVKPDLVASGDFILADGSRFTGTAASSAVVAGFAALLMDERPSLTVLELINLIREDFTIDDNFIRGVDSTYGYGILTVSQ